MWWKTAPWSGCHGAAGNSGSRQRQPEGLGGWRVVLEQLGLAMGSLEPWAGSALAFSLDDMEKQPFDLNRFKEPPLTAVLSRLRGTQCSCRNQGRWAMLDWPVQRGQRW